MANDVQTLVYAAEIQHNTPSAANAKAYAQIIRERAIARHIASVAREIDEIARMPSNIEDKIAQALGVSPGRISQLKATGGFSFQQQCVLEKASGGAVLARQEDEPEASKPAA